MMITCSKCYFFLFNLFLFTTIGYSQVAIFTSTTSGDFDNPVGNPGSPWSITSGTDSDGVPDRGDEIIINVGHIITASSSTISEVSSFTNNGTLILNSTHEFLVWGSNNVFLTAITSTNSGTISGAGTLYFITNNNFSNTGTIPSAEIKSGYGTTEFISDLTVNGRLYLASSGTFKVNNGNILTLNNQVRGLSGTNFINEGTVIVNDSRFFTSGTSTSLSFTTTSGHLNWNNSGNLPIPVSSTYKDLTISNSCSYNSDFNVTGNFINNATFTPSSSGLNINFNGLSSQDISGSGILNVKKLTLNNSNGLQLSSGTINIEEVMESSSGSFTQNGANIVLKSTIADNAGMIKVNNASDFSYSSGSFNVERFYNASSNGWRMICSPVKNSTLSDVDDEFIFCGVNGASAGNNFSYAGCGSFYSVLSYNEVTDDYSEVTSINQSISAGNGTLIYTSSGSKTLIMGGARSPNFDAISYPVTRNGNGYNLVSNPYPATIDWSVFQGANSIQNAHWIFSGDAGNFLSSTNNIPHSQGFFINANSSGNISFNVNQTINSQAGFVKSVNGIDLPLSIKITSDQNSYFDYAHVEVSPNFSSAYDSLNEITKFYSPYPEYAPNIYFLDNDSNDLDRICINNNQDEVLFFDVKVGSLAHGNYTIDFENISQFMIGSCISVEDLHTGISTDLRLDSNFIFISDSTAISPRFKMNIEVDYDIHVTNSTCFQDSSAFVKLYGNGIQGSYFNLLDSSALVLDSVIASSDSLSFNNLNAGVFNISTNHNGRCSVESQDIFILEPENVISNFTTVSDTFYIDSGNTSIYFNNHSTGTSVYFWDFGDGTFSNEKYPLHEYNSSGNYNVILTSSIDSSLSCQDSFSKLIFIVDQTFLNIATDKINNTNVLYFDNSVHFKNFNNFKYVSIYNLEGKLLLKTRFSKNINVNHLKKGLYIVSLENDNNIINQKLLVH
jgi:hypothetical protein